MLTTLAGFLDLGKSLKTKLRRLHEDRKINFINVSHFMTSPYHLVDLFMSYYNFIEKYGYDWRRNLDLSSAELIQYLENLKRETGESTTVIAHSMGGLVVLYEKNFPVFASVQLKYLRISSTRVGMQL